MIPRFNRAERLGVRWQSEAATALSGGRERGVMRKILRACESGVALRLPPQSMMRTDSRKTPVYATCFGRAVSPLTAVVVNPNAFVSGRRRAGDCAPYQLTAKMRWTGFPGPHTVAAMKQDGLQSQPPIIC